MALNLVALIKMHLNETDGKVRISKHLSDAFSVQNSMKKDSLSPLLSTLL
jgi:hypothetical protein